MPCLIGQVVMYTYQTRKTLGILPVIIRRCAKTFVIVKKKRKSPGISLKVNNFIPVRVKFLTFKLILGEYCHTYRKCQGLRTCLNDTLYMIALY